MRLLNFNLVSSRSCVALLVLARCAWQGASATGVEATLYERSWTTKHHWVGTWASMPQLTEPANLPPAPYNQTNLVFSNSTIRQTIRISLGADIFRLRLSNAFGTTDLSVTAVTIALPVNGTAGGSAILPQTLHTVTFGGNASYTVPSGALVISDPIRFPVKAQSVIAVTIYLAQGQTTNYITSHPGSRTTSWFSQGNVVSAANITTSTSKSAAHWYFISAVEAWVPSLSRALAVVGDSITDGRGSDTDKNNRWPDLLLARMQTQKSTSSIAILNQAAGGNRVLADGLGPNAVGRIDRDVLAQSGVRYVMLFEGVNDIGTAAATSAAQSTVGDRLIAAYQQIIGRVHAAGIPIFAATITPFSSPGFNATVQPYADATREATRQRVNTWIRESGRFDAVVDFDAILRNSSAPSQLDSRYHGGDFLHPNMAGYQLLADKFPLGIFEKFEHGVDGFI